MDVQLQHVSTLNSVPRPKDVEEGSREAMKAPNRQGRFTGRINTPTWLSVSMPACEICAYQARSAWTFMLQNYRIVSTKLPIWAYIEDGNTAGVQRLFMEGKVSLSIE